MLTGARAARAETFTLQLARAVTAADLQRWYDAAPAGAREEYASGIALPRGAEGVVLAQRMEREGKVRLHQRRDPADARRWQFLIVKVQTASGPATAGAEAPARVAPCSRAGADAAETGRPVAALLEAMLEHLRDCAGQRRRCGSNAELARAIGLAPGKAGRDRAQYLLVRLVRERRIAVAGRGTCRPRVVTVLAEGRAQGKSTFDGG